MRTFHLQSEIDNLLLLKMNEPTMTFVGLQITEQPMSRQH